MFQKFDRIASNEEISEQLEKCRQKVHKWGRTNRVTFDAAKEHMIVIHPTYAEGDPFKLLGLLVTQNF